MQLRLGQLCIVFDINRRYGWDKERHRVARMHWGGVWADDFFVFCLWQPNSACRADVDRLCLPIAQPPPPSPMSVP